MYEGTEIFESVPLQSISVSSSGTSVFLQQVQSNNLYLSTFYHNNGFIISVTFISVSTKIYQNLFSHSCDYNNFYITSSPRN